MLTVQINDQTATLPAGSSVVDAVAHTTGRTLDAEGKPADGGRLGVAVALAGAVVPRSRWVTTPLSENAELEIVTAVQGG